MMCGVLLRRLNQCSQAAYSAGSAPLASTLVDEAAPHADDGRANDQPALAAESAPY